MVDSPESTLIFSSVSLGMDCYLSSRCKVQNDDCHVLFIFVVLLDSTKKQRFLATTTFPENTTSVPLLLSPKWYCTCCCAALRMIDGAFTVRKEIRPLLHGRKSVKINGYINNWGEIQ